MLTSQQIINNALRGGARPAATAKSTTKSRTRQALEAALAEAASMPPGKARTRALRECRRALEALSSKAKAKPTDERHPIDGGPVPDDLAAMAPAVPVPGTVEHAQAIMAARIAGSRAEHGSRVVVGDGFTTFSPITTPGVVS